MQKIIASFLVVLTLAFGLGASLVNAQAPEIPEKDGVYNDPDHPGIKVRVFVYREKPNQSSNPSLVCGITDPESSAFVDPTGWKLSSSLSYKLNTSSVPSSVGSSNLPSIASNAFSQWANAVPGKVNFSFSGTTSANKQAYDNQNIVSWGKTQGSALAVTYTRYNSQGQVVDVDTIMNNRFQWAWSQGSNVCAYPGVYDAQDILTHELGHWMGLNDEYTDSYVDNTMYGYGSKGEVKKDTLTSGDKAGVNAIYQ